MKRPSIYPLMLLLLLPAAGCRKYSGEKAAAERAAWHDAIRDSITEISARRHSDSLRLAGLHASLAEELPRFTQIGNPREVEPYYILSSFKASYPLTSTGIAARMTASEQYELIAALSGSRFDAIRVTAGGASAESDVVPADQALNYTAAGLTTVAFSGARADSIGELVQANAAGPVTLEYLSAGRRVGSVTLSGAQKDWLSTTWSVCGAHSEAQRLERSLMVDARKIQLMEMRLRQEGEKAAGSE